jgi:predicted dithiol-disulfide oxidoreductase (DUF899 family)
MQPHQIVSREEWIEARKAHMAHEKEYTRARDRLSQERRALPWVKVDKNYVFDSSDGKRTLADLFKGRSQLVVQHFMFAPDWSEGCKSCSFWADGFERMAPHLAARDTTLVAVSRAPLEKLLAFAKRMGWTFDWLSSAGSDFNYDFAASFTPEQVKSGAWSIISAPQASGARTRPASACSTGTRREISSTPIPASPAAST